MERTMSSKYDNVCRLCLSTRGETEPIFSSGSSSDESASPVLATKIEECVSVKIEESDGLSTQICKKCVCNVNNWHIFKKICNDAQVKLRDWVNSDGSTDQDINIKKEPLGEDLVEDEVMIDASYPPIDTVVPPATETRLQPEGPPILASLGLAPRNEKNNVDPRADWDRVVAIQTLIDKDEAVEGGDSAEEEDRLDISEVDTDSDQELQSHDEDTSARNEYKSKDGYTKWSKKPDKHAGGSLKRKGAPGCSTPVDGLQTPAQAWACLFTDSILDGIIDSTNDYIEKNYPAVGITGDMNENLTSRSEIKALFGILYLSGIMRPAFYHSSELWWGDGCGLGIIQSAMTLDRFRFLLKCLRFDIIKSKDYRLTSDKLSPIRQVLEEFTLNCKQSYNIGDCAVIDERILPFEGNCSFRKSFKSKKYVKNGIKIYSLIEADTFYTSNIEICSDSKANGELARMHSVSNAVSRLVTHLSGTGLTIVTRARMTSLSLANRLNDEFGLNLVGSLQSKRKEVPVIFSSKENKTYSSHFGFTNKGATVISYTNPKRKSCLLLTTRSEHYNTKKYSKSGAPEALVWYKQRRGAPAVSSTLAASYSTSRRTSRWPLALFFHLLDIAAINSQVLWMYNRTQADVIYRRNFLRSLALELMNEQVKNSNIEERPPFELDPLLAIRGGPIKNVASSDALLRRNRRCKLCPRNADRKTRAYCVACNTPACKEHYKPLCICCALKF